MMTYFTLYHWIFFAVLALIYAGSLFMSLKNLKGQVLVVSVIILHLVVPSFAMMGSITLDKSLKKASMSELQNRRILRNESITFYSEVKNTGDYTIGTVTLELKLINKGMAVGNVKGSDFYQPNSFWDMLLSIGNSKKKQARPNSITIERVVATNLKPHERKKFRFTVKFPSYFKDVLFREKLILH